MARLTERRHIGGPVGRCACGYLGHTCAAKSRSPSSADRSIGVAVDSRHSIEGECKCACSSDRILGFPMSFLPKVCYRVATNARRQVHLQWPVASGVSALSARENPPSRPRCCRGGGMRLPAEQVLGDARWHFSDVSISRLCRAAVNGCRGQRESRRISEVRNRESS